MKLNTFTKTLSSSSLIEVLDDFNRRLYYGTVQEISPEDAQLLTGLEVEYAVPFTARVGLLRWKPAIQIKTLME